MPHRRDNLHFYGKERGRERGWREDVLACDETSVVKKKKKNPRRSKGGQSGMRGMADRKTSANLWPHAPFLLPLKKRAVPCFCAQGSRAAEEDEESLSQNVTAALRLLFPLSLSLRMLSTNHFSSPSTFRDLRFSNWVRMFFFWGGGGILGSTPVCLQVMSLSILCITER